MITIPEGGILENRLAVLRKKHGLSQAELAARAGMKQPMYNRLEKNASNLTVQNAIRLATVLNEPLEALWWQTEDREQQERGFNFLGMLQYWQLVELKEAVEKEILKRDTEKDGE